jgi:hypothetical protein
MQTILFKTLKRRLIIGLLLASFLLSSAPAVLADSPPTPPPGPPPGLHPPGGAQTMGYSWGG